MRIACLTLTAMGLLALAATASAQVDPDYCRSQFALSSASRTCNVTSASVSGGLCQMRIPCRDGSGGYRENHGAFQARLLPHYCNVDGELKLQAQSCRL